MKLVIGNKNYSTWSLRPWLMLSVFGLEFEEEQVSLKHTGITERLGQYSPTARVPVLIDEKLTVWDSLAICEYVSERYLDGAGWPAEIEARARARALVCEMHAGFSALRAELPMNCRAHRKVSLTANAQRDIERIAHIWTDTHLEFGKGGPWLFGEFSIADCFYAPVALRFPTYGIELPEAAERYATAIRELPEIKAWIASAIQETETVEEDEAGEPWELP
ncbi:MAG: glutathione S-transferase [Oleiphilus sp.]|nr:MAG: glutathione S-transferase [Oleiphilus sp.]